MNDIKSGLYVFDRMAYALVLQGPKQLESEWTVMERK